MLGLLTLLAIMIFIFGAALAAFGVTASVLGLAWFLWPIITIGFVLIALGYSAVKRRREGKEEER